MSVTRSAHRASDWFSMPSPSTTARVSRPTGMTPQPISFDTKSTWA